MIATEVVDHILSFLHSDRRYATLETCSVVFPQIAERHLYSQITFQVPGRRLPRTASKGTYVIDPARFSRILIERPYVANYVRIVQIIVEVAVTLELSHILSILPRITSITLGASQCLPWPALGPEFCMAFRNSVHLPLVKKVAIFNIRNFSLDVFDDCEKLRTLLLSGQFVNGESVSTSPSRFPRLYFLRVDSRSDLTRIISWMRGDSLQTLSLCMRSGDALAMFRPLIKACTTLTNLELDLLEVCDIPASDLILPDLLLPRLEHFTFHSHMCKPQPGVYQFTQPPLKAFLASIKSISSLTPIRLTLHLQSRLLVYSVQGLESCWSDVAAVLVSPIFCYPIDLHISERDYGSLHHIVSLCEQSPDMKRLLGDGKLMIVKGAPLSGIA